MIAALIFGFLSVVTSQELTQVEELKLSFYNSSSYNCTRFLNGEETTSEPPPTFPTTSFTCWGRYDGYYADIELDCTIFHYCQTWEYPSGLNETVKWDFACPLSTIFNQKILSCTPPSISFDCQESPNYYWVNYNLTLTTTSPTPTEEFSTPSSNVGQQLIVGGFQQKSVTLKYSGTPGESFNLSLPSDIIKRGSGCKSHNVSSADLINFPP